MASRHHLIGCYQTPAWRRTRKRWEPFDTDSQVADFLVWWAIRDPHDTVLDPSFGGGVFLRSACERLLKIGGNPANQVYGVEIDAEVHAKIAPQLQDGYGVRKQKLILSDFFALTARTAPHVDVVVGNPPFIRYQRFAGDARKRGLRRASEQGLKLSERSSSWLPFLVHSIGLLRDGGRLAMVIPVEICHAAYARPVLEHLSKYFAQTTFLTFRKKLFADLSEDTLLLLGEGKGNRQGPAQFRWSDLASAGALDEDAVAIWGIPREFLCPAVRRGRSLAGVLFTKQDWRDGLKNGESGYLLRILRNQQLPAGLRNYLAHGEARGVSKTFKCRTRSPWFSVPHVYKPDAFLTYMSGHVPRLVANAAGAVAPNSLHILRLHQGVSMSSNGLAAVWQTSLSALSAEIEGHALGGGMLKLEPTEAENVLIACPDFVASKFADLATEMNALGRKNSASSLEDLGNVEILQNGLGLTSRDCEILSTAAAQLRSRRMGRSAA